MKDTILTIAAFLLVIFASLSFSEKSYSEIDLNSDSDFKTLAELRQNLNINDPLAMVDSPVLPRPDTLPKPMPPIPQPDSLPRK